MFWGNRLIQYLLTDDYSKSVQLTLKTCKSIEYVADFFLVTFRRCIEVSITGKKSEDILRSLLEARIFKGRADFGRRGERVEKEEKAEKVGDG